MRIALVAFLLITSGVVVSAQDSVAPRYTQDGSLQLPSDYREWVFVSAGLGMTYGPQANVSTPEHPSFENVFVNRAAYQTFVKTGKWPDKTTFVLEIRTSDSKGSINKGGHYQSGIAAVEAEVKDGGKWTFYAFGRTGTEGKALARTESCYTCHAQNAAVDNTFVQFYPTLLPVAREKGTVSASFKAAEANK
jgi:hypothetical protein